jgi:hypothetical protein
MPPNYARCDIVAGAGVAYSKAKSGTLRAHFGAARLLLESACGVWQSREAARQASPPLLGCLVMHRKFLFLQFALYRRRARSSYRAN